MLATKCGNVRNSPITSESDLLAQQFPCIFGTLHSAQLDTWLLKATFQVLSLVLHTSCTLELIETFPDGDDENQVYEKFQKCKLPSSGHCVWLNVNEPFDFAHKGKEKRKD